MNICQVSDIRLQRIVQRVQLCLEAQNSKESKVKVLDNLSSWFNSLVPKPEKEEEEKGLVSAVRTCA